MNRTIRSTVALLSFALIMACAQLGLQPAQSFDEKLAYGYATTTSIRTSARDALDAKTIKVSDAQNILVVTDQARVILDQAKAVNLTGDTSTATGKLSLATSLLIQLQQFLVTRGAK